MILQLDKAQLNILVDALQERIFALHEKAEGKFEPRPGSHRHQLQLEAHGISMVLSDIHDQLGAKP